MQLTSLRVVSNGATNGGDCMFRTREEEKQRTRLEIKNYKN